MEILFHLLINYFVWGSYYGLMFVLCSLILRKILFWRGICDKLYGVSFFYKGYFIFCGTFAMIVK